MKPETRFLLYGLPIEGWFFSPQFNYYQRVQGKTVVYLERMFGHYRLILYKKGGPMGFCTLEARIYREFGPERLFDLGVQWLEKYQGWNESDLEKDEYHIANPEGLWGRRVSKKLHYLNNQEGFDASLQHGGRERSDL